MKIAFYVEDGLEQIVFTPETETEKGIVSKMHDGSREMSIYQGGFYECRGGWVRQNTTHDSTIVVLRKRESSPPTQGDVR